MSSGKALRLLAALALVLLCAVSAQAQVAYETSFAPAAVTFDAAGEAESVLNVPGGSGSNRVILVFVSWRDRANTISGVTYGGTPMTAAGVKVSVNALLYAQLWYLANPSSGNNTLIVTMGASSGASSAGQISALVVNGADISGTPVDGYNTGSGTDTAANTVSSVTIASQVNDRVVVFHATQNGVANLSATATNYTERQDAADGGGFSQEFGDAAGASSVATSATWSNAANSVNWASLGINVNASGGGGGGGGSSGGLLLLGVGGD